MKKDKTLTQAHWESIETLINISAQLKDPIDNPLTPLFTDEYVWILKENMSDRLLWLLEQVDRFGHFDETPAQSYDTQPVERIFGK